MVSFVITGHRAIAEDIFEESEAEPTKISEEWKRVQPRQPQYCLQTEKCKNIECCLLFRSGL